MKTLSILSTKLSAWGLHLIGRGGSMPGSIGCKVDANILSKLKFNGPVILVTGTNGKTTIGYMMYQMMTMLDIPCAYMGTIGFYYCGNFIKMVNTTPDVDVLYEYFIKRKMLDVKCL